MLLAILPAVFMKERCPSPLSHLFLLFIQETFVLRCKPRIAPWCYTCFVCPCRITPPSKQTIFPRPRLQLISHTNGFWLFSQIILQRLIDALVYLLTLMPVGATLKAGIRNLESGTGTQNQNQNPESGKQNGKDQRKQVL